MPNEQGKYVRYSESVEVKQPNEGEDIKSCLESFARMQGAAFEKHRHAVRGAHAKSHGLLKGELKIYENLPEELRQGVCKTPRTYPIIIRYSTSPPDILRDGIAAFRGMAIKLIGVPGKKLSPEAEDAVTQDFILANDKTLPTGDVASYLKQTLFGEKLMNQPQELAEIITTLMRAGSAALRAVGIKWIGGVGGQALPETHILGNSFYTTAALRFGDYIAKLNATPVSESLKSLHGTGIDTSNRNVLRDLVVKFFRENSVEYEFGAQLCTDLERMPVEDGSVEWPEDESPYRAVGKITIPAQEAYSAARRVYVDDYLSFSPWHCISEHQPLGSIMRVRRSVYAAASEYRHRMNALPRVEPSSIDELPD
jgi:hypothetical protein